MSDALGVLMPVPLSAEDAYWHACANVAYEVAYLVPEYGAWIPAGGTYYFVNPQNFRFLGERDTVKGTVKIP